MIRALALAGALVPALALSACAAQRGDAAVVDACDLKVEFGSYAMGEDEPLRGHVLAFLDDNRDVTGFDETRWGREGESTLCLHTAGPAATERTWDALVGIVPRFGERAPTRVIHRDGRVHTSALPPGGGA